MKSIMQMALGADWNRLPPALQAHYRFGCTIDNGHLDIAYPRFMQPCLSLLRCFGILVNRCGEGVPTVVRKDVQGELQHWQRTMSYGDGQTLTFNSRWAWAGGNRLIEWVNPFLGLQMAVQVHEGNLHYEGMCFVLRLGPLQLPIPEALLLGHTRIVETALDDNRFAMDFRLIHPILGQTFSYAGTFAATPG
jgi:hypothetical protein